MTNAKQELIKLKLILKSHGLRCTQPQLKLLQILIDDGPIVSRRDIHERMGNINHPNLTALLDRFESHYLIKKTWSCGSPEYHYLPE